MIIQKKIIFCQNQTSSFISNSVFNVKSDLLTMTVEGSFTNGNIKLEGRESESNTWVSLAGINISNFSVAKSGITSTGIYEFSIAGIRELRVNVEQVAGGSVTVSGQFIQTGGV